MDTGQVQAQSANQNPTLAGVGQQVVQYVGGKAWDWITEKGVTTVVIENLTSKVLRLKGKGELLHKKQAKFIDPPPTEIIAAKSQHDPTRETFKIETKGFIRSVTSADTSGWVDYEIEDTWRKETKDGPLVKAWARAVWTRKGKGEFSDLIDGKVGTYTNLTGHKFEVQQVKGGTIIYRFSEDAPSPKPKDPQPPADPKQKDPAPPAEPKLKKPLEFTIKPFTVGKDDKLDEGGDLKRSAHEIWNDKRLAEIKRAILQKLPIGQLTIEVHGYASNTDTAERNLALSKRRAEAVIKALNHVGVPLTAFTEPQPHGEWETKPATDDKKLEKEDAEWRKVVVKIFP
jgi:outer membrane protein OmpA-like peptidoglycan-associated protein